MTRSIVVIHGAGPPLLRHGKVYWPDAPAAPASYRAWAAKIAKAIAGAGDLILVGHSLGASLLLKCLSEHAVPRSIVGLFLIAAPYWGVGGWEAEEFTLQPGVAGRLPVSVI
jgi:predicted alpha/beta hydrolase family esterase